jgi:hypothetical protein
VFLGLDPFTAVLVAAMGFLMVGEVFCGIMASGGKPDPLNKRAERVWENERYLGMQPLEWMGREPSKTGQCSPKCVPYYPPIDIEIRKLDDLHKAYEELAQYRAELALTKGSSGQVIPRI